MATDPADRQLLANALSAFAPDSVAGLPVFCGHGGVTGTSGSDDAVAKRTEYDLHKFGTRWTVDDPSPMGCLVCGGEIHRVHSRPESPLGAVMGCVGWAARPWFFCEGVRGGSATDHFHRRDAPGSALAGRVARRTATMDVDARTRCIAPMKMIGSGNSATAKNGRSVQTPTHSYTALSSCSHQRS